MNPIGGILPVLVRHAGLFGNVQFTRGCPFQCEFCDIIVTFGRKPRMGFDHVDVTVFDAQVKFISVPRVINVMLGMLSAIPKAPLYDRMVKEGRLDTAAELRFSTNIVPLRIGRERLRDGFVYVLSALNDTAAYFDRLEALYLAPGWTSAVGPNGTGDDIPGAGPRPGASFSVRPSVSWLGSHGRWGMPPFAASISGGPGGSLASPRPEHS